MKKLLLGTLLLLSITSCTNDNSTINEPERIGHIYRVEVPYQTNGSISPGDGIINMCAVLTKNPNESTQIIDGINIDLSNEPLPSYNLPNGWHYTGEHTGNDPIIGSLQGYNWMYALTPSTFSGSYNANNKKGRVEFVAYTGDCVAISVSPQYTNTIVKIYQDNILYKEVLIDNASPYIKFKV